MNIVIRHTLLSLSCLWALSATVSCGNGGGGGSNENRDGQAPGGHDAGSDADAQHIESDAEVEEDASVGTDAAADATADTSVDAQPEAGMDASDDASVLDAAAEAGQDSAMGGEEGGLDASDAAPDASTDADAQQPDAQQPDAQQPDAQQPDAGELVLSVWPNLDRHPISPFIYGVENLVSAQAIKAPLVHMGNDEVSAYNWEINASNTRDGDEELNVALGSGGPGAYAADVIAAAQANAGMALLSVPMGSYVAADADGTNVLDEVDYLSTRFVENRAIKGAAFSLQPDPGDGFVYQDEFVNWVQNQAGTLPVAFALDNEPGIWNQIHPSFHTQKATYDDVVDLGIEYALAIKDAWPEAEVAGPVSYGWLEYVNLQESSDSPGKGWFLPYYLAHMATAEQAHGRRLLDYLDVHWYSEAQANGERVLGDSNEAVLSPVRVQAPRALWDAAYREPSWIQDVLGNTPIQLVPRLREMIDDNYPGTKLSISGWSYGGGAHISGALAAADVLGIFGRDGVDLAVVDLINQPATYIMAGFRAFLDYDGAGAKFGDTSVRARSADDEAASVYASVSSGPNPKLVIIAINKQDRPLETRVVIDAGTTQYTTANVYRLTAEGPSFAAGPALTATSASQFSYTMPKMSISVIVPAP